MKISQTLLLAAVGGLLSTAVVACGDDKPAADPSMMADGGAMAAPSTPSGDSMMADAGMGGAKHACKGQNGCKGQGGCKTA